MTKRWGAFDNENSNKKQKTSNIEALWGDGLDDQELEECFEFATQVVKDTEDGNETIHQSQNVTILPNYSMFKVPGECLVSSTQLESKLKPSSSSLPIDQLERELKKIKQENAEKEGEITILRSKLQESKLKIEQQKINNDWRDKLQISQKEMKTIKSELEFKNLEIANLKQKLLDVKIQNNLDITLISSQLQTKTVVKPTNETKIDRNKRVQMHESKTSKKESIIETIYPLKHLLSPELFKTSHEEQHIINNRQSKISRNTLPYLQNQKCDSDFQNKHKCFTVENKILNIDYVYPEIFKISNCSTEMINSNKFISLINKTICVAAELIYDFYDYLKKLNNHLRMEDIQQADSEYLKSNFTGTCDFNLNKFEKNEIGIKSGQILRFLGELLPFSHHLTNYVCHNKDPIFNDSDQYLKHFPNMKSGNNNLLNLILDIVKLIGLFRKGNETTYFMCSVVNLLINISKSNSYGAVSELVCLIAKEIIFARPTAKVIYFITGLFKTASCHTSFVEFVFGNTPKSSIQTNLLKGISHFNSDVCPFAMFAVLYKNTILKMEQLPVVACINMLTFIENTLNGSFSRHHQSNPVCSQCLRQLYRLEIETVFRGLEKYMQDMGKCKEITSNWSTFLSHNIVAKVLRMVVTNNYEITEYITIYSQFKEIEQKLTKLGTVTEMEKLSINDDELVTVTTEAFTKIEF